MAALPTAVKLHILTALACFETPTRVVESVKAIFGLELSRQCVEAHHPYRRAGARLDPKWRAIFDETRTRLLTELDNIPIACQAYRLRQLDRLLERTERMGNLDMANQVLKQAAMEVGGMYRTARKPGPAPARAPLGQDYRL
jgi:hypothetical protein